MLISGIIACSNSPSRAPVITTCDSFGRCSETPWITRPGNGTFSSNDASIDDSGSQAFEARGTLRSSSSFTRDLSTSPINTQQLLVIGRTAQSNDIQTNALPNGEFTLANVVQTQPYTWLRIAQADTANPSRLQIRTVTGFTLPIPTGTLLNVPIFDPTLPASTLRTLNSTRVLQEGDATVVIHIVDQNGLPRVGVTAKMRAGAEGPLYDDGDGLTNQTSKTSVRGTIVFLGVPYTWLNFDLGLTSTQGEQTFTLPIAASAFTFAEIVIPN